MSFSIHFDATDLSVPVFAVHGVTAMLDARLQQAVSLEPGLYQINQGLGPNPASAFEVRADGTIDYPASSDGFISGRGTSTIQFHGIALVLDLTQISATAFNLSLITAWFPSGRAQLLKLLPSSYQIIQGNGAVPGAVF